MSFLDNLENNLKALERQEERDLEKIKRDHDRREAERLAGLARAPHREALKTSTFTSDLLGQCRAVGRTLRVLVRFAWIGDNLRLDVRQGDKAKRMELTPEPDGVVAIFSVDGEETGRQAIDPAQADAERLVREWLGDR